jgi:hypothetical protein
VRVCLHAFIDSFLNVLMNEHSATRSEDEGLPIPGRQTLRGTQTSPRKGGVKDHTHDNHNRNRNCTAVPGLGKMTPQREGRLARLNPDRLKYLDCNVLARLLQEPEFAMSWAITYAELG